MAKKNRVPIPLDIAARVQFLSDRVCCVCRIKGKPIQLHHIDSDPSNNEISNLCVLCFDCHRETQISGGFDRKLDAGQITLYRDDWHKTIAKLRNPNNDNGQTQNNFKQTSLEETTSLIEIYNDIGDWESLAKYYHRLGNNDLRDKYIEKSVNAPQWDQTVWYLRGLQGRPDLIPKDLIEREVGRLSEGPNYFQRARLYKVIGRNIDSAQDYITGIKIRLEEKIFFTAAFYLSELFDSDLIEPLFIESFKQASDKNELHWQLRALQELGWENEICDLISNNQDKIRGKENNALLLAEAKCNRDDNRILELRKNYAMKGMGIPLSFPPGKENET